MYETKVSVIVPVYNAEKYIKECIESVINQEYENWELILINDGSTDNSLSICNCYVNNERIRVISKMNEGVSIARNAGLKEAHGEWITFLDADDKLLPYALNIFRDEIDDSSIIIAGSTTADDSYYSGKIQYVSNQIMIDTVLNYPRFLKKNPQIKVINYYNNWSCWGKFFKTELIQRNNIEFNSKLKLGEDLLFCLKLYNLTEKITINDSIIYYYRPNPTSATGHFRPDRITNTKTLVNEVCRVAGTENTSKAYHFVTDRIFACIRQYYLNSACQLKNKEKASQLKSLCEEPLFKEAILNCDYSYLSIGKKTNIANKIVLFLLRHKMYRMALFCAKVI